MDSEVALLNIIRKMRRARIANIIALYSSYLSSEPARAARAFTCALCAAIRAVIPCLSIGFYLEARLKAFREFHFLPFFLDFPASLIAMATLCLSG